MNKKKYFFNRSDFISLAALLFSMMAVFVSIYEARILKEQQLIMLSQEKTAVWPYVDGNLSFEYADKIRIKYTLENKGIGPSKIRKMDLLLNGQEIVDYIGLVDSLSQYFPDIADLGVSYLPVEGDVLSPNEEITTLVIESKRFPGDLTKVRNLQLYFDICYCSVYDDCWRIGAEVGEPRVGCD